MTGLIIRNMDIAQVILASDWLVAHDAQVRAEALEAAAVHVETWMEDPHDPNEGCGECSLLFQVASTIRDIRQTPAIRVEVEQKEDAE